MPRSRLPRSRIFHRLTLVLSIMALVLALPASVAVAQEQAQNGQAQDNAQNDQAQDNAQNVSAQSNAQNDQAQDNASDDQAQDDAQTNQAQGNKGFIQLSAGGAVYPPSNEPHLPCTFDVNFYNYPESVDGATTAFTVHPPSSNGQGPGETILTDSVVFDHDTTRNPTFSGSATYSFGGLLDGYERHAQQGYHIKLTVDVDGEPGSHPADRKHHVFWVDCPPEEGEGDEDVVPVALTVTKVAQGDAGTTLSGAEFALFQDDGDGVRDGADDRVDTCTTDASGVCLFPDLDPDSTYFLVETAAPADYQIVGNGVTVVQMADTDRSIQIENAPVSLSPVSLTVTKVSTADAGTTLPGATFDLFQDDGDGVFDDAEDEFLTACTTNANGVCPFADLDPDSTYFLVETAAPSGYEIIGDGVTVVAVGTSDTTRRIANAPVDQVPGSVTLTLTKVSSVDATVTLQGAVFDLFRDEGAEGFDREEDTRFGSCTTDADGTCVFAGLTPDTDFLLVETTAPTGYEIIGDGVTVVTVGTSDTTRRIANAPVEEVAGSVTVTLTKVSSDDATVTLQGAVFDLFRDEGAEGFDREEDTRFGSCTTDADGTCVFAGLTPGTDFLLIETAAPVDFEIVGDGVTPVTTTGDDTSITIENLPAEEVLGDELESPEGKRGDAPGPEGEAGDGAVDGGQAPGGDDAAGGDQAPEGEDDAVAGVAIDRAEGQAAPEARTELAQTGLNSTTALALIAIGLMAAGMLLLLQPGWRPATVVLDDGPRHNGSQGDAPGPVSGHAEVRGMQRLLLGITLSAAGWSHVLEKPAWRRAAMARGRRTT